jgi:hypothetical protein
MKINTITIDSTNSLTDLCKLGIKYPTDKSPYNTQSVVTKNGSGHRHPYTAVYDLIFSNIRYNKIKIAEIGILDNMSMLCWREYFPNAELYGFDFNQDFLSQGKSLNIKNTTYNFINVKDEISIKENLEKYSKYDIIIEDSTHQIDDQIRVCKFAHNFLVSGGILIVEDIFRNVSESIYSELLSTFSDYYSSATFVITEHELKYSPGWDNDKLLILFRNDK